MTTHAVHTAVPATTARTTHITALPLQETLVTTVTGRRSLAVMRLATGFIFLWAFLDKTFGLGFATPIERAWITAARPLRGSS
jgi:thiosulfate dehydrogenase [quinone] large subunit